MIISKIEQVGPKKFKIYIDGEYAFFLYSSELYKYDIHENEEISKKIYEELKYEVEFKRAKIKAMNVLQRMDRSEQELRTKLSTDGFTQEAVNHALEYVLSYRYIDDERYAQNYIRYKQGVKSRREIEFVLGQKGIDREVISRLMEEHDGDEEAIRRLIYKKTEDPNSLDPSKKQKLIASLCRKGFPFDKVKQFFD